MIEVVGLTKRYGRREALRGVSFTLEQGVTGLLGPNGAGKTTLLRCMLGIIEPSGGRVTFAGESKELGRGVGYLPQKFGLLRELTVREALEYFAALKRVPREEIESDIDDCLRQVNMLEAKASRVGALSGGMLRRVGIAAALLGKPSVLIFDEPTAGLDPEERVRFKRLAARLAETHSVLISTHIVEDIEALAGSVIVLHQGLVRAHGTLQQIAELADGRCFLVPQNLVNEYSENYYVEKYVEHDGRTMARVLSESAFEGFEPAPPTVEDGYLCATRDVA